MAKAGHLLFIRQHFLYMLDRVFAGLVNGLQHAHHSFVRTAMQRPLQRTDGAGNGRVHICQRCRDDACGKCRRIQLVVGMQDQRDIQCLRRCLGRFLAGQHPQKIARVRKRLVGFNHRLAFADAIVIRDDHCDLRSEPERLAHIRFMRVAGFVIVIDRQTRNRSAQHFHRRCILGKTAQQFIHLRMHHA